MSYAAGRLIHDAMADTPPTAKTRFYADNFVDLMGCALG